MEKQHITTQGIRNALAKKIVELHLKGYDYDFVLDRDHTIRCLQNSQEFDVKQVKICHSGKIYDENSGEFKHVNTVDPGNAERGLLLTIA